MTYDWDNGFRNLKIIDIIQVTTYSSNADLRS